MQSHPRFRHALGAALLLISAIPALALSQDSVPPVARQVQVVRPQVYAIGDVTRLCHVYSSGVVYCREVEDLVEHELSGVGMRELQQMFDNIYRARGFDQRFNGLVSCGSETFAAAPPLHRRSQ